MADTLRKLKKSFSLRISFQSDSNRPRSSDSNSPRASRPHSSLSASGSSSASASGSSSRLARSFSFHSSKSPKSCKKTCAICLGSLRRGQGVAIFTAECSHSFHFNCIAANVQHGNRICPICRCEWKEIPFQAPANITDPRRNNTGRGRVTPHNNTRSQLPTVLQLPSDADNFADDEPLPVHQIGPASPSQTQALTVKAFPEFPAVSAAECPEEFAVLLRIRAPPLPGNDNHLDRAPIDLVTVLDVSASMAGKLALLKRAVRFIIQNLGPADRLSIVVFSSVARRIFPLRRMSDRGREDATHAVNSLSTSGGTNIVEGLKKGVRVLEERRERNPVASIILLSDGQDTHNVHRHNESLHNEASSNQRHGLSYLNLLPSSICPRNSGSGGESQQSSISVHTFGFGLEHDSVAMHAIADASGGTFSFIESIDILQDAFARCIGGLLSVVSQDVRLVIKSISSGVRIVSIPSGRYKSEMFYGEHGVIDIGDLYADEEKEFLLYLSIPKSHDTEGKERSDSTSLLDVFCTYRDSGSAEIREVNGERVEIRRPEVLSTADKVVSLEVDRQRTRLLVADAIASAQRMAEMGDLAGAQGLLAEQRLSLLSSASAQAGDGLCNWLEVELREVRERMSSMDLYERTGRAYVLSGLSSHSWQRATTRGDSTTQIISMSRDETTSYETPSMVNMVSRSQTLSFAPGEPARQQEQNKSCSF